MYAKLKKLFRLFMREAVRGLLGRQTPPPENPVSHSPLFALVGQNLARHFVENSANPYS